MCERKCGTFQKWTIHRGIRRGKNQAVPGSQGTDAKAPSDSENAPQVQVLSLNLTHSHIYSIAFLLCFAIFNVSRVLLLHWRICMFSPLVKIPRDIKILRNIEVPRDIEVLHDIEIDRLKLY